MFKYREFVGETHRFQCGTAAEHSTGRTPVAHIEHRIGDIDFSERGTPEECLIADSAQSVRKFDGFQRRTVHEYRRAECVKPLVEFEVGKACAIKEGIFGNVVSRFREFYLLQRSAAIEGINLNHTETGRQ